MTRSKTFRVNGLKTLYEQKEFVGKSTVQVGRKARDGGELVTGDAELYEKWSQAISSAYDLVAQSDDECKRLAARIAATVILPILVIPDETLWTADYSEEGQLIIGPRLVDECTIYLGKEVSTGLTGPTYTLSHLHIFTKSKFDGFLDRVSLNDRYWSRIFPDAFLEECIPAELR